MIKETQIQKKKLITVAGIMSIFYMLGLFIGLSNCTSGKKNTTTNIDADGFMGDLSCKSCHEQEYNEWYGSHHDLAMQKADSTSVLGDFHNTEFTSNGVVTRFFTQEGKYMVNTEGPDGNYSDFNIKYTFGVEPLQQYLVEFPGGKYQCLLTAWDTEKNEWFDLMPAERLATDDWLHWTKGSMTWNAMCADCHSTNLKKNYNELTDTYNTTWSIIDVSCEACHGPAKDHFRYVNSNDFRNGKKVKGSFMKQSAGLGKSQQIDDCARCHSRRGQITEYYNYEGSFMDHYLPSMITPGLYYTDGQILDEVYVYGSFLQSKMNHRNVSCIDCHNPHSLELKFQGNQLCLQCHIKDNYDTPEHHFHKQDTEASQCINCHMTGKVYMGNDYRRDHSFRVPRPDLSIYNGSPNACNQCHTDQTDQWASDAIVTWYGQERIKNYADVLTAIQQGNPSAIPDLIEMVGDTAVSEIIQASILQIIAGIQDQNVANAIIQALEHYDPLVRFAAISALADAPLEFRLQYLTPLLSDSTRIVRTHTAYMLADAKESNFTSDQFDQFIRSTEEFETSLKVQSDFPAGQLLKGQFFHKKNELGSAEKAYLSAIEKDPYLPQPYFNLANIFYGRNELIEAKELFDKAISLDSNFVNAYYSLGLLLAEMNNLQSAEFNLGKAATISGNVRYYYNWGLTLQNLERREEAESVYLQGLNISPNSEIIWYALTILYIQNNDRPKARNAALNLNSLNPNNPEYQNLLQMVQ